MLELTGNSGFKCKSSMKAMKLSTHNADSYIKVIKYHQEQKVSFRT